MEITKSRLTISWFGLTSLLEEKEDPAAGSDICQFTERLPRESREKEERARGGRSSHKKRPSQRSFSCQKIQTSMSKIQGCINGIFSLP